MHHWDLCCSIEESAGLHKLMSSVDPQATYGLLNCSITVEDLDEFPSPAKSSQEESDTRHIWLGALANGCTSLPFGRPAVDPFICTGPFTEPDFDKRHVSIAKLSFRNPISGSLLVSLTESFL